MTEGPNGLQYQIQNSSVSVLNIHIDTAVHWIGIIAGCVHFPPFFCQHRFEQFLLYVKRICFVHILGCVGVGQSENIHFVAESRGGATVVCWDFPSETYSNIEVCNSVNVSFTNISFENCGPLSPNVFFNHSSGIVFDGCIFM